MKLTGKKRMVALVMSNETLVRRSTSRDSLMAMKLVSVCKTEGLDLTVANTFAHPTLSAMAGVVRPRASERKKEIPPFSMLSSPVEEACLEFGHLFFRPDADAGVGGPRGPDASDIDLLLLHRVDQPTRRHFDVEHETIAHRRNERNVVLLQEGEYVFADVPDDPAAFWDEGLDFQAGRRAHHSRHRQRARPVVPQLADQVGPPNRRSGAQTG